MGFLIHKQRKRKEKEATMMEGWVSSEEDVVWSALLQQGPLLRLWMTGPGTPKQPLTLPTSRLRKSERSLDGLVGVVYRVMLLRQFNNRAKILQWPASSSASLSVQWHSEASVQCECCVFDSSHRICRCRSDWEDMNEVVTPARGLVGGICPSGSECCIALWVCASFRGDVVEEVVHRESFLVRFSDWFLNKDRKEKTVWYLQRSNRHAQGGAGRTGQRRKLARKARRWHWRPRCPSLVSAAVSALAGRTGPPCRSSPSHSASTRLEEKRSRQRRLGDRWVSPFVSASVSSVSVFIWNDSLRECSCTALLKSGLIRQSWLFWSKYTQWPCYKQPTV